MEAIPLLTGEKRYAQLCYMVSAKIGAALFIYTDNYSSMVITREMAGLFTNIADGLPAKQRARFLSSYLLDMMEFTTLIESRVGGIL